MVESFKGLEIQRAMVQLLTFRIVHTNDIWYEMMYFYLHIHINDIGKKKIYIYIFQKHSNMIQIYDI